MPSEVANSDTGVLHERPATCENPEADCYREPVVTVFWVEDDATADWPTFEKWLCYPCAQAMIRGYGASEMPDVTDYRELIQDAA